MRLVRTINRSRKKIMKRKEMKRKKMKVKEEKEQKSSKKSKVGRDKLGEKINIPVKISQEMKENYEDEAQVEEIDKKEEKIIAKVTKHPFRELLAILSPNCSVSNVLVNGVLMKTSNFVSVNLETDIAYFVDTNVLKLVSISKIDAIEF
ncbi:hypothetical protein [Priestia koreensis]|uniref:hypothetical protein n=1 Tax=Priestia koreensis TaxID=284581 RepID=UPI002040ACBE|nr:hypothetical protein [Priestia koreensis]MCM3006841.1 hypothetical protein [Priestia koreensis]